VKVLVEHDKTELNLIDGEAFTPLMYAIACGNI